EIGRPFDRGRRAYDAMSFRPRRCRHLAQTIRRSTVIQCPERSRTKRPMPPRVLPGATRLRPILRIVFLALHETFRKIGFQLSDHALGYGARALDPYAEETIKCCALCTLLAGHYCRPGFSWSRSPPWGSAVPLPNKAPPKRAKHVPRMPCGF